ncbi:YgaP family membrane protein [Shewanella sp. GXUN23E]|uniref:YgaP family membrane protein n=1 Tax=Shewanella sp. GXUN23E TaxID=3422498 RepID=UPI003D7D246F
MSLERAIMAFAGFMVILSLILTATVSHNFIWLTAFVGANLFQSAFTGFCPAAMLMRRMGVKSEAELSIRRN